MVCPSQRSAVSVRGSANNWSLLQPRSFGPWDSKNIFVPGITEDEKDDAHNAVLRLMDHGVGEEALAVAVRGTEVRFLDANDQERISYRLWTFRRSSSGDRISPVEAPANI
jgi:hypothetical protein